MKPVLQWLTLILVLLVTALCSRSLGAEPLDKAGYLATQATGVQSLSAEQLRAKLDAGEALVILDVRSLYERENGRTLTDNEVHIPRGFLEFKAWDKLPRDKTVVVYCGTGARSRLATDTLLAMGWERVVNLDGGITGFYESVGEECGCVELPF
ncbi:rhodanese-like domain-containing protein [Ferrimonas balearica]|uniref:rhodanese-like domain-containing protein n=1 Tax=Ferrimonas balearica TaxID=44012 RepID=UPI001C9A0579|nr:rhodanese-like domain-containing protein [Ferrimonas balearica]MBY5992366.1 rhodanese-like domain-containing protein [Ferrimonas balearica]